MVHLMFSQMRRAALGLLALYWLAIFVGTHLPISLKGGDGSDKVMHFLAFTGLAFLMALGVGGRRPTWRTYATVLLAALMYAGFDEVSQLLVGRHCDFWDWVADSCGTAFGLLGYLILTVAYQFGLLSGRRPEAEIATP